MWQNLRQSETPGPHVHEDRVFELARRRERPQSPAGCDLVKGRCKDEKFGNPADARKANELYQRFLREAPDTARYKRTRQAVHQAQRATTEQVNQTNEISIVECLPL